MQILHWMCRHLNQSTILVIKIADSLVSRYEAEPEDEAKLTNLDSKMQAL